MKKYIVIMFLLMSATAFEQTYAMKEGVERPKIAAKQTSNPYRFISDKENIVRINQQKRNKLLEDWSTAFTNFNIASGSVERVIGSFKKSNDPHLPKEETLRKQLWDLSVYDMCREKAKKTELELTTAHAENARLKQSLASLQKELPKGVSTSVASQEAKELKQQLITVKKEAEDRKLLINEITKDKPELPLLLQLKKRAKKEFGKNVYEKMIAGTDLALPDLFADENARFRQLIGAVSGEEELSERELQMNLRLEQLRLDNEKCNEKLASVKKKPEGLEQFEGQAQEEKKQNEELVQLKTKNKVLKEENEKLQGLSSLEGAREALLSKDSELKKLKEQFTSVQSEVQVAMDSKQEYVEKIIKLLSRMFGGLFSDAVINRDLLGEQDLIEEIDRNTPFMQKLCNDERQRAAERSGSFLGF